MLLTDGNPNTSEDLRAYESAILSVANTEAIDLEVKLGLATEEVSQDVLDFLLDHTSQNYSPLDYTLATNQQATVRRAVGVSDVVVTRQMKRWHAAHTLEIVYRDAFNNQLNDRYQAKFDEYRELAKDARAHTFRFGVALVLNPIPAAPAATITSVAGALGAATYYAQIAWVSATGQEGSPSCVTTFDAPAATVPVVSAMNPPTGATGFNVYLGLSGDAILLQPPTAIPVGQSFTVPGSGLVMGRAAGDGQAAAYYITGAWMLRRG